MTADLMCLPMVSILREFEKPRTESEAPRKLCYGGPAGGASELLRDLAKLEATARRRGSELVALGGRGPADWRRRASEARRAIRGR